MALLTRDDGIVARNPLEAQTLEDAGYQRCYTQKNSINGPNYGQPCNFYLSPEAQSTVSSDHGGYFTCPNCRQSHDLLHEMPWHGVPEEEATANYQQDFSAGGGTRIGLLMTDQAQIGEDLVKNLGELPGYGPITWWHPGNAGTQSPLDGATADWGIEVKTLGYDATHHRFVPGRPKEKGDKNQMALEMGKKGILGVLVLLDYRRSVADIYVQEHPLVLDETGTLVKKGVKAFRSSDKGAMHLVKEVPFKNPLMDPHDPQPVQNQIVGHEDGIPVDAEGYAVF